MSNAAILYLRLLRKIVRESAWRLGGGEETFLAGGFGGGDGSKHGGGEAAGTYGGTVRIQNPACGGRPRAGKARHGNRQIQNGKRHFKRWTRKTMEGSRHK